MSLPRECISQARRLCSLVYCLADREKWDMPEDVPPGGTGALLRGKLNPENALSFLFRCFFFLGLRFGGGCWRGFGFCEVASHKFEFLHGKLLWQPASGMQCFGKDCYRELTESNERV